MLVRLAASAIVVVSVGGATAADLGGPAPALMPEYAASPAFDWSGLYFGAHGGYGSHKTDTTITPLINGTPASTTGDNSFTGNGALAGVQAGYNFQTSGGLVIGIEGDIAWTNMDGSFNFDAILNPTNPRPEAIAGQKTDWLATIRGRAGFAFDRTLLYGTGGVAFASMKGYANNFWHSAPADDVSRSSATVTGWTVGGGAEFAVNNALSLKAEYLYAHFSQKHGMVSPAQAGGVIDSSSRVSTHLVKLGLNYRFR